MTVKGLCDVAVAAAPSKTAGTRKGSNGATRPAQMVLPFRRDAVGVGGQVWFGPNILLQLSHRGNYGSQA